MNYRILLYIVLSSLILGLPWMLELLAENRNLKEVSALNMRSRDIRLKELRPNMDERIMGLDSINLSVLLPNYTSLRTDQNGFILPSKIHEHADLNVFFMGGSTTACEALQEEDRFPYLIGRLLEEETSMQVNSYNCAVPGNHSLHELNLLTNKIVPLDPDIVVLKNNVNDLFTLLLEETYWNTNAVHSLIKQKGSNEISVARQQHQVNEDNLFQTLFPNLFDRLYRFIYEKGEGHPPRVDEWINVRGKTIEANIDRSKKMYENSLQSFVTICQVWNIEPVLMTQAYNWPGGTNSQAPSGIINIDTRDTLSVKSIAAPLHAEFNEIIRMVALDNDILLIDLADLLKKEKDCLYDEMHYTPKGSALVADIISDALVKLVQPDSISPQKAVSF